MSNAKNNTKITVKIELTKDDLKGILITAVEGGMTAGWAKVRHYNPNAGTCEIAEHHDGHKPLGPWHKVTPETLVKGLQLAAKAKRDEGGWTFAAWMSDRAGDAIIADVILQFCVLGEVIYG